MCSRSPHSMSEWPMGALPPIVSMRVTGGTFTSPFGPGFRFRGRDADLEIVSVRQALMKLEQGAISVPVFVVRKGDGSEVQARLGHVLLYAAPLKPVTVGTLRIVDPETETIWRVSAGARGMFATQATPDPDRPGTTSWFHFLDSFNQDVTPYVHTAVASVAAGLIGFPVSSLKAPLDNRAQCITCKAFRRLRGTDQILGDAEAQYASRSTSVQRTEGPWAEDAFWCSARQEVPPDVARLVREHNALARRGYHDPVLPLDRAGEDCTSYLHQNTGRKKRNSLPPWDVPAAVVGSPVIRSTGGRTVITSLGAQWEVSASLPL